MTDEYSYKHVRKCTMTKELMIGMYTLKQTFKFKQPIMVHT